MKIGIIGYGFVGKAVHKMFPNALLYDAIGENSSEAHKKAVNECDAVFVCVPTNLKKDNTLDMSIVEEVVSWCESPLLIIRSTLQPGFSQYLEAKYNKVISVVPEYVGETVNHPLLDESKRPFLVIGGDRKARAKVIEIFQTVYNANVKLRLVTNYAAELIKLAENRAIAFKVMELQELYDACQAADIDYYTIRDAVYGDDPRFNLWFTFVYPENRGFHSSKCLSKDVPAWVSWAKKMGYKPEITELLIKKSKEYGENKPS